MTTIYKYTVHGALDAGDIEDMRDTPQSAADAWAKEVLRDIDIITITATRSGDDIHVTFTTQDEDQQRMIRESLDADNIPFVFATEDEDEHDRLIDRRYRDRARELEGEDRLGFMDLAHSLTYAQEAMVERIDWLTKEMAGWASTIHEYGALKPEARKDYDAMALRIQRLQMSHDRIGELLAQQGEENEEYSDGWLTKACDIWIRG